MVLLERLTERDNVMKFGFFTIIPWHDKMEALGHEHAHVDLPVASRVYVAPPKVSSRRRDAAHPSLRRRPISA